MMHPNSRWVIDASVHRWPTLQWASEMISYNTPTVSCPNSRHNKTILLLLPPFFPLQFFLKWFHILGLVSDIKISSISSSFVIGNDSKNPGTLLAKSWIL